MPVGRPAKVPRTAFGERLYKARTERGLSQESVAGLLGLTQHAYAKWERHEIALLPTQIEQVAEILEIPVSQLFKDTSHESRKTSSTSSPQKRAGKK